MSYLGCVYGVSTRWYSVLLPTRSCSAAVRIAGIGKTEARSIDGDDVSHEGGSQDWKAGGVSRVAGFEQNGGEVGGRGCR